MARRFGCGPIGCLWRLLSWVVAIVLLALIALAVIVGVAYFTGPRPARRGPQEFLSAPTVACLELNTDLPAGMMSELLPVWRDSFVAPLLDRAIAGMPAAVRPFARAAGAWARRRLLRRAIPYAVDLLVTQTSDDSAPNVTWAVNSRVPVNLLSLAGWPPRRRHEFLETGAERYELRWLGAHPCILHNNWLLVASRRSTLQAQLRALTGSTAGPDTASLLQQLVPGSGDIRFSLDNRVRTIEYALNRLELNLLNASEPANREVITHLVALARPFARRITAVTGEGNWKTADSFEGRIAFRMRTTQDAQGLAGLLEVLRPFLSSEATRARLALHFQTRVEADRTIVLLNLEGTRPLLFRWLRELARHP